MRINIDLDTSDATDLIALTALVAALRGDKPVTTIDELTVEITGDASKLAEAIRTEAERTPRPPTSESLIEAEAARVAEPSAVDSSGLPYDERIHSSTKAVNNDGSWRNKRGVDPALVASVTAELRAAAGPPVPEPQTPEAAFSPPADASAPPAPPPGEQQPPAPPAPPAADTPPPPPVASDGITYPSIIKAANDKGLTYDQLNQTAVTLGLSAFKDLVKRPDLFESFMASIG